MSNSQALGVDIGGSGVKAAIVDVDRGQLLTDRQRIATPQPATPAAVATVVGELRGRFDLDGPIGCAFPGVVQQRSMIRTAANLDPSWIGVDAASLFGDHTTPVTVINDADAAGLAEMRHGAGRNAAGTVIMVTVGTGLGTAVFLDGELVPNTELGHIEIDGVDAETHASSRVVGDDGLRLDQWAPRFERYLCRLEDLLWPDLFILGGGISKQFDEWAPLLQVRTPVLPAELRNQAGIVGAAMVAD